MKDNANAMLNSCINKPDFKPDYKVESSNDFCTGEPLGNTNYHNFYGEHDKLDTVEEIVNFDNTSPLEIGRYQPHSNDNVITLKNTLSNIIKKCES